jgi:aldehyde:ferredoxin oxidoreductase
MAAGGYVGKWLHIDLGTQAVTELAVDEQLKRQYLGGYGLGARILYELMPAGADPLGPANVLGFLTGPLTGTPALIGSRYVVVGKSPLTGGWGDANSGGTFGPKMKFAGIDGAFFSGISANPVYLFIHDGVAELRSAASIWGKNVEGTERALEAELGNDIVVASIGTAGEKCSFMSCIINDGARAAGRSGLGAVMGSKRLKAVVVRGKSEIPLADPERAKELRRKTINQRGWGWDAFTNTGTCTVVEPSIVVGDSPVKNWGGAYPQDFSHPERIAGEEFLKRQEKKYTCWHCPLGCGGKMKSRPGQRVAQSHKPEYETIIAFGSLCLNEDPESILAVNDICNDYGLDTMSTGTAVAFAIECHENGLLPSADAEGLELGWGNSAAIVELTEKIAKREGVGALLADGVRVAAQRIGKDAEGYAIHIGGQEPGMHDPKLTPGFAARGKLDATPGRHTIGSELYPPVGIEWPQLDHYEYASEAMAERRHWHARMTQTVNAAGLCFFGYCTYPTQIIPEFLAAVTGWDIDLDECLQIGERILTMRHLFNLREGVNPLDREVPGRWVGHPPFAQGPHAERSLDVDVMVENALRLLDWDRKTAAPSEERLTELGLQALAAAPSP